MSELDARALFGRGTGYPREDDGKPCQWCGSNHLGGIADIYCSLAPNRRDVFESYYGPNVIYIYRVPDRVKYFLDGQEQIGYVLWGISPKAEGSKITPAGWHRFLIGDTPTVEGTHHIIDIWNVVGRA